MANWEVNLHPEVDAWYLELDTETAVTVTGAINYLEEHGPGLGRPTVDSIQGSRHHT